MFKKKLKTEDHELLKLAKKYKKILDNAKELPKDSFKMYKVIRKAEQLNK